MYRKWIFLVSFILILGLLMTSSARAELIGWWKFDHGSGTTAIDSSDGGFDITLHNTTWEDGLFGSAVHFHGRGYGNAGNFKYNNNAVTVCAWVWHDTFRIGDIERYVTVAPEVAVIRKEGDGRLHFYIKTGGNLRHLWVDDILTEGKWYYVVGTWNGSNQRLYVDGEEIAGQAQGGVLGNTSDVMMSSGAEPFNGKLDEVRIYNHPLGRAEIQALMQGEKRQLAFNPTPVNGATSVDKHVTLSWTPGFGAQLHTVYFGDNFDDVKNAAGGLPRSTPSFTPGPLEPGKTYYWRVDEFDGRNSHKGEVWSFTVARLISGWSYDGGIMVGAYYYPWYGPSAHRVSQSLRWHLVPQQTSELGEYDSSSPEVITRHIDYSHRANIHFWLCSWWGPGTNEDNIIRHSILPHRYANELRYAILYESTGRLGSFSEPDYSNLLPDFRYFADNFFSSPNYLKIDGRPVVFIYLTRVYFRSSSGYRALADLRATFPDIYIIADDIFGRNYSPTNASKWDAVTAYDVYGQTLQSYGSTKAAVNHLERILSQAKTAANSVGVGLIPFATPGFNDKGVRDGHVGAPRYFEDKPASVEGDLFRAMLRDVVVPKVDPLAEKILMVTSFNEWHEDTQIEPTMGTAGKTNVDDSASGSGYTQGDYYTDYGYLYLDILCQETSVLPADFLSDALDTSLSFTTGGSADWFRQTSTSRYDGDAAQSGDISDDRESWMQTTVTGKGTLKFWWTVSSEEEYDFLEFYIDGSLQEKISGTEEWEGYWQQMAYNINTSGSHILEWRYVKDGAMDEGSDCGWVDKLEWIPKP
jgi:glycoprotein endo-alpha-1,2-mannosidase